LPGREDFLRRARRDRSSRHRRGAGRGSASKRGKCVAFLGFNSPEMLALFFSCARLGALFMPLNWRLAAPEHGQMLRDCPPQGTDRRSGISWHRHAAIGEALAGITLVACSVLVA
jgi:acyl-CoA synthetase (AMP-forming)/AMP-acid ligase II